MDRNQQIPNFCHPWKDKYMSDVLDLAYPVFLLLLLSLFVSDVILYTNWSSMCCMHMCHIEDDGKRERGQEEEKSERLFSLFSLSLSLDLFRSFFSSVFSGFFSSFSACSFCWKEQSDVYVCSYYSPTSYNPWSRVCMFLCKLFSSLYGRPWTTNTNE